MKLSDYVVQFIRSQQVKHVFIYPGGAITHLVDSLYKEEEIEPIVVHHEQAGAFAADAYARINGNLGVTMATSGPGATNLITGIANSFFDSIPCLYITGQVNTYEYKFDRPIRQVGFQETDIVSIVKPITKDAFLVTEPTQIKYLLQKAVFIAQEGRPGPVLIDIPMNIQRAEIQVDQLECFEKDNPRTGNNEQLIRQVAEKIKTSTRPVILVGGGVRIANATHELIKFADQTGIPVVTTLMGLDSMPHDHPSFCGMLGAYGNRYANFSVANCDLLLAVGSRLTTRQTSPNPNTFARAAQIIHVDIDPFELDRSIVDLSIQSDAKTFLTQLNHELSLFDKNSITEWVEQTTEYKKRYPSYPSPYFKEPFIDPNFFMKQLSDFLSTGDIICLDVGQNQIWAAQSFELKDNQRMLISGGHGAMGYSLPAAIGAFMASNGHRVISISGDGGFQMNIQELQTVVRNNIPLKIVVMNNECLGMIRHFQEIYFDSRYFGTVEGYSCPNFESIANAYHIKYYQIQRHDQVSLILKQAMNEEGVVLIEVVLPQNTYVVPKLEMGRPIEDQSPLLQREEFRANMLIDPID